MSAATVDRVRRQDDGTAQQATRSRVPRHVLAANGYGSHSPGGYSGTGAFFIEVVLTGFFVLVILGVTDSRAVAGFAPLAIGFTLTLIHLIAIPIDNTSVNPARSTGVAFYAGNGAPGQLWLFWIAPIIGGLIAGVIYPFVLGRPVEGERPPANV